MFTVLSVNSMTVLLCTMPRPASHRSHLGQLILVEHVSIVASSDSKPASPLGLLHGILRKILHVFNSFLLRSVEVLEEVSIVGCG